jgi:hypothetical protein
MKNIEKTARNFVSIIIISLLASLIIITSISLCATILSDSNFLEILRSDACRVVFFFLTLGQILYYGVKLTCPQDFK